MERKEKASKGRKRRDREKTTCSLRSSPSLCRYLPFFFSLLLCLSVDRMLITARMTLILSRLNSSQKSSLSFSPLFTAPSWLLIFSATSLIMPAGHPVYSPSLLPPFFETSVAAPRRSSIFFPMMIASSLLNEERTELQFNSICCRNRSLRMSHYLILNKTSAAFKKNKEI